MPCSQPPKVGSRDPPPLSDQDRNRFCPARDHVDVHLRASLEVGTLRYLGMGRDAISLDADDRREGARVLIIGGEPVLMWWNFLARDEDELRSLHADWAAGRRFGTVAGTNLARLEAPT